MKITVVRKFFTGSATIGKLLIDGKFFCYTLEDIVRDNGVKIQKETAIPYGVYDVIINMSNRFKKLMPLLLNVPNFQGVRIHPGNTELDTEGCLLVGMDKTPDNSKILKSKEAYQILFDRMQAAIGEGKKIKINFEYEEVQAAKNVAKVLVFFCLFI
jgi:hypothetical protein